MSASVERNVVTNLTAFQRDLLRALAKADNRKGLSIKAEIADYYGEEINHSRLYQNLDKLVDRGLVEKRQRDRRTNEYGLTDAARDALDRRDEWVTGESEGDA